MIPFLLKPYYKTVIWGGDRISRFKNLPVISENTGESWEVSAMPGRESVVAGGPMEGLTLADVCRRFGRELMGDEMFTRHGGNFPLLIKYIDATDDLSVQVHPDEDTARRRHGCLGKNEMWYIVEARPGARIAPGLRETLTPESFRRRVAEGTFVDALAWYPTHCGDIFHIPAGRVHAAGAGNFIIEIQQPSDITYRICDYDRRDSDGNTRPLHVEEACEAIDYHVIDDYRCHADGDVLLSERNFTVRRLILDADNTAEVLGPSFTALLCVSGTAIATFGHESRRIGRGHTMLVPASTRVTLRGPATVLAVTP